MKLERMQRWFVTRGPGTGLCGWNKVFSGWKSLEILWEGEQWRRQVVGSGWTSAVPSIMILESQEGDLSFPFSLKSLLFGTQTLLHRQVNRTIIWNHRFLFLPLNLLLDVLIKLHRLYQVVTCELVGSVGWLSIPKVRQEHYFQWIISHIS